MHGGQREPARFEDPRDGDLRPTTLEVIDLHDHLIDRSTTNRHRPACHHRQVTRHRYKQKQTNHRQPPRPGSPL